MPTIDVTTKAAEPADTRVVPFFEGDTLDGPLQALADSGEAKPKLKSVAVAHEDGTRVLVAGMGKRDELDGEKARVAASAVAGRAKEVGAKALSWEAPDGFAGPIVEGTLLKLYEFKQFKSSSDDDEDERATAWPRLEMAGADDAEVAAAATGRQRPERRPRPAEPALERGHPDLPGRARAGDRRRARRRWRWRCSAATTSNRAGWARSPRWPRAPTPSRS